MYGDYGSPLYNPNINPFAGYQLNPYQQQLKQDVVKVNGEGGARAFPIGANSSALLLDESGKLVWLVTTDGAGYKTVMPYDISPHESAPVPDYNTLEQRIERLEELINGNTADTSAARNESHATEPEYKPAPKTYESREEREGRRSSYEGNNREQPEIQRDFTADAVARRHSERSFYETSSSNGYE